MSHRGRSPARTRQHIMDRRGQQDGQKDAGQEEGSGREGDGMDRCEVFQEMEQLAVDQVDLEGDAAEVVGGAVPVMQACADGQDEGQDRDAQDDLQEVVAEEKDVFQPQVGNSQKQGQEAGGGDCGQPAGVCRPAESLVAHGKQCAPDAPVELGRPGRGGDGASVYENVDEQAEEDDRCAVEQGFRADVAPGDPAVCDPEEQIADKQPPDPAVDAEDRAERGDLSQHCEAKDGEQEVHCPAGEQQFGEVAFPEGDGGCLFLAEAGEEAVRRDHEEEGHADVGEAADHVLQAVAVGVGAVHEDDHKAPEAALDERLLPVHQCLSAADAGVEQKQCCHRRQDQSCQKHRGCPPERAGDGSLRGVYAKRAGDGSLRGLYAERAENRPLRAPGAWKTARRTVPCAVFKNYCSAGVVVKLTLMVGALPLMSWPDALKV